MVYVIETADFAVGFESFEQFRAAPVPANEAEILEYCEAAGVNLTDPDSGKPYPRRDALAAAAYTGTRVEWKD